MNKSEAIRLPTFFNYKEENTDNGYETIQDFFLSWLFRCSDEKYKFVNPEINNYAKNVIFALVNGKNNAQDEFICDSFIDNDFKVTQVKTIRQFKKIDLIVELTVEENSDTKKIVLNIENKWYTTIRKNQLENSKEIIENKYNNRDWVIINLVIFADYEKIKKESEREKCRKNRYTFLTIYDIKEIAQMKKGKETGNALFDEYWFSWYK